MLAALLKAAPDVGLACVEDASKLAALYMIQPAHLAQLLANGPPGSDGQHAALHAAISSAQHQLAGTLPVAAAGAPASSAARAVVAPAAPTVPSTSVTAVDEADATQGVKPGDLAPQHAKQLVAEVCFTRLLAFLPACAHRHVSLLLLGHSKGIGNTVPCVLSQYFLSRRLLHSSLWAHTLIMPFAATTAAPITENAAHVL